jgi:large subunit ribosomal protein L3
MLGLLGKKLGQTRVYDNDGAAVHVTIVECGPNHVIQCKTPETDGYSAVQLAFDPQKDQRLSKPRLGHFTKHKSTGFKRIREFRDFSLEVKSGDVVKVEDCFTEGDFVDAIGITKGHGFQGVMKRWNFGGGRATHGAKGWKRRPGSIGSGSTPGWVAKGKKMPGHMGQVRRTVQNLKVVKVHGEDNLLLVKGAIPGADGDYVVIREAKKKPKSKA